MPKRAAKPINFNAQWSGRMEDLNKIGQQLKGVCGCQEYCKGSTKPVYGHQFRLHMGWRHQAQAFGSSRTASLGRLPSVPSVQPIQTHEQAQPRPVEQASTTGPSPSAPSPSAEPSGLDLPPSPLFDTDDAPGHVDTQPRVEEEDLGGEDIDPTEAAAEKERLSLLEEEERLLSTVEQEVADTSAAGPTFISAQEQARLAALLDEEFDFDADEVPTQFASYTYGPQLAGELPDDDLLAIWPFPIPTYLLHPSHAGNQPNPYEVPPDTPSELPVLGKIFPLLIHTLNGRFGVPRRAIELVLRVANSAILLAQRTIYRRMASWVRAEFPSMTAAQQESLDSLDPINNDQDAPRTAKSALGSIGVDTSVIVHPQCPNSSCHHVFYDIVNQNGLASLPPLCPECSRPTRPGGQLDVLFFPRRRLWEELEVVLAIPGIETTIEERASRKVKRDQEDIDTLGTDHGFRQVLREQDDGDGWHPTAQLPANPSLDDCLILTVNMGLDWANTSSNRSASAQSMGPITLYLADLPVQVRSSLSCAMVVGITPGPKEPRGANLHKLLLPIVLELRSSQLHGVWVKTPKHPEGRLIRVILGCIIADRPAAVAITGGGHFSSPQTPCLRCTILQDDIPGCQVHPLRNSRQHMRTCIQQHVDFLTRLSQDKEEFENDQEERTQRGYVRKPYPRSREDQLLKTCFTTRGHISALSLIPGYDAFANTPFDAMHAILEGLARAYFYEHMILGAHVDDRDTAHLDDDEGLGGGSQSGRSDTSGSTAGGNGSEGSDGETEGRSNEAGHQARQQALELIDEVVQGNVRQRKPEEVAALRDLAATATTGKKGKGRGKGTKKGKRSSSKRLLTPTDLNRLHELLKDVQTPMSIGRLHPLFGVPSAGSPSADDWRTFSTVFAPLVFPRLWAEHQARVGNGEARLVPEELSIFMGICELTVLALRSSISNQQLDHLKSHIETWSQDVFALHPSIKAKTNFHVVSHLAEDIQRFGPPYNTWSFTLERFNYIAKNVPQAKSSTARQVATLRAVMLSRMVEPTRGIHLTEAACSTDEERVAVEELETSFRSTNQDRSISVMDMLAVRYEEADQRFAQELAGHRAGKVPIRLRGEGEATTLQTVLHQGLQDCLRSQGIDTRTHARPLNDADRQRPYVPSSVTLYNGMEWTKYRFDAAHRSGKKKIEDVEWLVSVRNSLFEHQTSQERFGLYDSRFAAGVLCLVFEHRLIRVDDQGKPAPEHPRLYAVIRRFQPFSGVDPYGYDQFSLLGVQLWEHGCLAAPEVVCLTDEYLGGMRPLAVARLPLDVRKKPVEGGSLWATQPIDRH